MHFTKGVEKRFPKLFPKGSFEFKILRGYEIFYNEIRKDKRRVVTVSFCDSFLKLAIYLMQAKLFEIMKRRKSWNKSPGGGTALFDFADLRA